MKPKSYIGITGFRTVDEVERIARHIESYPIGYVMFGITSSNKRLLDPTSSGKTSPPLKDINALVKAVPRHHLPMIHYFTDNPETLAQEVVALFEFCGLNVDTRPSLMCGLQLNATWPDPDQLNIIQEWCRTPIPITLQLPKEVLEKGLHHEVSARLKPYEGLIQYALIDPSGGQGRDVDLQMASQVMLEIAEYRKGITPGVAGGFNADNVAPRIKNLAVENICLHCNQARAYDYCIDAQGGLRDTLFIQPVFPKDAKPLKITALNTTQACSYIDNALKAFCEEE